MDGKRKVEEGGGGNYEAAVSCISPLAQVVYTGDEDGRVVSFLHPTANLDQLLKKTTQFEWTLVQRER